jgi:hypothetical protein
LMDQHGQVCRVYSVSRKYKQIKTKRWEDGQWYDSFAVWSPTRFNKRNFRFVRAATKDDRGYV